MKAMQDADGRRHELERLERDRAGREKGHGVRGEDAAGAVPHDVQLPIGGGPAVLGGRLPPVACDELHAALPVAALGGEARVLLHLPPQRPA